MTDRDQVIGRLIFSARSRASPPPPAHGAAPHEGAGLMRVPLGAFWKEKWPNPATVRTEAPARHCSSSSTSSWLPSGSTCHSRDITRSSHLTFDNENDAHDDAGSLRWGFCCDLWTLILFVMREKHLSEKNFTLFHNPKNSGC